VKNQNWAVRLAFRWLACSLGLWIAEAIVGSERMQLGDASTSTLTAAIIAGLILALINMFLKPILVFLSIPALLLTLGFFLLVVNGFLIILVSWLYDPLYIKNFGVAVIAGVIVGLVNYLVTRILEDIK